MPARPTDSGSSIGRFVLALGVIALLLTSLSGLGRLSVAAAPVEILGDRDVVARFFDEVLSGGDLVAAEGILSANVLLHTPDGEMAGYDGLAALVTADHASFPDIAYTIDEMTADGNLVTVEWTMTGTHMGTYRGLAATGAAIALRGVQVFELDNYLIVESWAYFNRANLLNQIHAAIARQVAIDYAGAYAPVASVQDAADASASDWSLVEIDYDGPDQAGTAHEEEAEADPVLTTP